MELTLHSAISSEADNNSKQKYFLFFILLFVSTSLFFTV